MHSLRCPRNLRLDDWRLIHWYYLMVFRHWVNKRITAGSCASKETGLSLVLFNLVDDLFCVLFMLVLMQIFFPHRWKHARWGKHEEGTIGLLLLHHARPHLIHRLHLVLHYLADKAADVEWAVRLNLNRLPAFTLRNLLSCMMPIRVRLLLHVAIRRLLAKRTTITKRAHQLVKVGASAFESAINF